MPGKNFIIQYHVYPFDLMVSMGQSDKAVLKALKSKCYKDDVDLDLIKVNGQGRCVMFSGGQTIIRMKHLPDCAAQFGYLQHEVFHAVEFLFNRIGITHSNDSSEAFSYLIGYITTEIYKNLKFH
jgi:hypothetical protein